MGFTGMFSVETVLKIIGFGIKVGILEHKTQKKKHSKPEKNHIDKVPQNQQQIKCFFAL